MKLQLELKLKNKAMGLYANAQDVYNSAYKKYSLECFYWKPSQFK